ncbi:hypothetical protein [Microcella humidisoli]|uniref:Histidinol dehydrogenase n=1 Tax=Microcella humidisoli TaxID=2963406 RepID=A0ABY5FVA8_9MICO|nr:hypothetical protein [Microcella humidisoli]UTT61716.1 hypothetical protein NNL39_08475 [Microcella humidisoli]
MLAIDPDFARMSALERAGVAALCLGGGVVLGLIGTFAHQSLPPIGVGIALITVALYIVGLRAWGGVRTPAAAGALGVGGVSALLATATGGSVLVPANTVGYAWLVGITAIAFLALAWPHIQRAPQSRADTMEGSATATSTAHPEVKERPLP